MCGKVVNQLCLPGAGPNQRLSSAVNSDYAQSPEAASRSDPHHCASDNHRRRSARDNRKRDRDLPHPGRSGGCVPHRPTRPRCLRLSRASSLHWYLRKETKRVLRLSSERESSSLLRSEIRRAGQIAFGIRSAKSCRLQYGRGVHGPARELISADRDIVSSNESDRVNRIYENLNSKQLLCPLRDRFFLIAFVGFFLRFAKLHRHLVVIVNLVNPVY